MTGDTGQLFMSYHLFWNLGPNCWLAAIITRRKAEVCKTSTLVYGQVAAADATVTSDRRGNLNEH